MILSVIIPTKDRSSLLAKALGSIERQTLPEKLFEILVIDNGSADNTREIVKQYEAKIENLRYFYDATAGLHTGRHVGLRESRADLLVYLDDDVELFPNHLCSVLESFEDKCVALVGGKNLPVFEENPPAWLLSMWRKEGMVGQLSVLDLGDKMKEIDSSFVWGCNFSVRKSVLYLANGFHPDAFPQEFIRLRGDGESHVSDYVKENGYKTIYNPGASVYHFVSKERMTEEYFCKRMFNQGISNSYSKLRKYQKFSDLKNRFEKKIIPPMTLEDKMNNAYLDGYIFHQIECLKDAELLKWVLKERYFE
ncbi:glycosyltransferase family 2 protein [Sulfurospirillum tamanense]|uniref:glycosyltransferase family 2 protein n=1 Tax=Sulfurospirillum tamanense TaxID=2813362 RepID=UPI0034E19641